MEQTKELQPYLFISSCHLTSSAITSVLVHIFTPTTISPLFTSETLACKESKDIKLSDKPLNARLLVAFRSACYK